MSCRTPAPGRTRMDVADDFAEPLLERIEPALAHRDGGHHRHAELALERLGIELQSIPLGKVHHVERDDDRAAPARSVGA